MSPYDFAQRASRPTVSIVPANTPLRKAIYTVVSICMAVIFLYGLLML